MGMNAGIFNENFDTNYTRAICFCENGHFLTKYGHKSRCFLGNGRFFDKICALEPLFFREKSEKKSY